MGPVAAGAGHFALPRPRGDSFAARCARAVSGPVSLYGAGKTGLAALVMRGTQHGDVILGVGRLRVALPDWRGLGHGSIGYRSLSGVSHAHIHAHAYPLYLNIFGSILFCIYVLSK